MVAMPEGMNDTKSRPTFSMLPDEVAQSRVHLLVSSGRLAKSPTEAIS